MKVFDLGRNFRRERERLGLSTEEVSFLSGVSRNHIGLIERGEKIPRLDTAERISKALNKELYEMLTCITPENKPSRIEKIIPYLDGLTDIQFEYILNFIRNYLIHSKNMQK